MWIYIIVLIVLFLIIYTIYLYNKFVKLDNKVEEAFSTMDVYFKKRWDLIPNIVEIVKSYAKHEKTTLASIVELRNNSYQDLSFEEKLEKNKELSQNINKMMALVENYPNLKASDNFKDLSSKLASVEDDIANSRKYYNGTVRLFNNSVEIFPNNIFAKLLGFKEKSMFEISSKEKENVKIEM